MAGLSAALNRRMLAVWIASLIGAGLVHNSAAASMLASTYRVHAAAASLRGCPYLRRELTSVAARGVSCRRADAVARAYVLGRHHPLGFRCRRVPVYQGGIETNWYGVCKKGRAVVHFTPE
jgi:hypothetical protein